MGVRLIYGKPGSGKSEFCFQEIAKLIENKEKKIYMITPEQFSFTAEKKLMEAIGKKAVIQAEVVTLSRMAYRIMQEVGGNRKTNLSKCGKAMIIYSILNQSKKELKFLGKTEETIDIVMTALTEFKKHKITVEQLREEINNTKNPYLKVKLEDMTCLYEKFENQIKNEYIEENDILTILTNQLSKTDMLKNSIIYLDEFAGFTKQEYEVIKEMMKQAKQLNITVCTDELGVSNNPDTDIFYTNKLTVSKILDALRDTKVELEEPVKLENDYRFKTKELKHLCKYMKENSSTKYKENVENIHLFLAKNPYSEIEEVAKQITKLITNKKKRYQDIAIIAQNLEDYDSLVRAIFAKYNIPVFIDERRDLNQNIVIQHILAILEILVKNFSNESIFNYLKLGFLDIEQEELFGFENYCNKWGIQYNKWKKDFTYEKEKEEKKNQIERWNELRVQIINPLLELKEKIEKEKTVENISKSFYEFIQKQELEKKLIKKIGDLEKQEKYELAAEYKESYETILEILEEMVAIFKEKNTSLDQYTKIIKIGLKNSNLGKIPGTQDQVTLGNTDRSRTHKVSTVFIIGLNDGNFPSVNKQEGFFQDEDRQILKEHGIELANGTLDNLYEEQFNVYKAFTTAEESIYLSYSSSDKEGKSLRPSILLHKLKRMFPEMQEESDIVEKKYEIINSVITYEELIENIAKRKKKEEINNIWYEVYKYYQSKEEWNKKLEEDLKGLEYTNLPNNIKKENIEKLYADTLNTSVSKLEKYRSCPFSYYLQYGLKLKEKEELKVHNFDTGSFMHETIEEFFELVKEQELGLAQIEEEIIYKMVCQIIDKNLRLTKNVIFTTTAKYKMLVQRLKKMVSKALKYIIQTLIYSDFTVVGTEKEFGQRGDYKPITLNLSDGKKIEITGKIDRIDMAKNEDGKFLRIIDYKSSSKNIDLNEVYAGIQIQLLTYMDAICKEEDVMPAGIFYFSLIEQMVKADKKIQEEEIEELIRKNFKMKGLIVADIKIIKMNDNSLTSGSSKLVPAAITTSGSINEKWTNGATKEEFEILQNYIMQTIKQIGKEILSGRIDLKPYNKKGKTPCKYCNYQAICGFSPEQKDNQYRYIDKKTKDDMMKKIKEELEEK